MSDLERLDEALERYENDDGAVVMPLVAEVFNAARAYRDLLANGERVEWCEEHKASPATVEGGCGLDPFNESCRIVSKLLVDPTTEEER